MTLSKRSNGYYYVYYLQSNGKRTSISTGTKIKAEALKFFSNFKKNLEERKLQKLKSIPLQQLINDFLQFSLTVHKPKTFKGYKITLKFLFEFFDNIPIKDITTAKLNDYFVQRINSSSLYQARKDFICINSMFNRAVAEGYLIKNPCDNIKRFKIPQKQPLFFTELQFDLLLSVIDSKVIRDIVILAVQTGMRQSEILNLKWNQINFKDRFIILDNQTNITKSKKVRTIPLSIKALQILTERQLTEKTEFVFTINDRPINQDFLSHKFHKYVLKANINPKLNFHSLRHTFASWLVQKGVSIYEVQKLLGHSSVSVTQIYAHLQPDNLRGAIEKLNDVSTN
ncbi:tyrosine-type recombinase/integrase [Ignavibacteria bacterium 4148-Me]|uniref:tyrosine-type recombinase/integrase n=1 Tax=Rosettibacter primus TaxID=3111523 RepID=UPI00336BB971